MATIKSFTDIPQSKRLSEILPLESADFCYIKTGVTKNNWMGIPEYQFKPIPYKDYSGESIGCWSLAALLGILPTLDGRNANFCKDIRYDKWHVYYHSTATLSIIDTERYDNLVDACYEMILKLHELNLL